MTHSFPTRRSSDLAPTSKPSARPLVEKGAPDAGDRSFSRRLDNQDPCPDRRSRPPLCPYADGGQCQRCEGCTGTARTRRTDALPARRQGLRRKPAADVLRSEEHTSELQSLMRISYAVFCLKKKI